MKKALIFVISFLMPTLATGQNLVIPEVDNTTYTGKAMFGYQGWFGHPNDGSPRPNFWHWGNLYTISTEALEVEMYPDLREFCPGEKYPTAYTFPNGQVAEVFSSANRQTVHRHMKWVRDYNTDGVFVQRFISEYGDPVVMAFRDCTTVAVMEGCEKYGRVFSIMYDGIANRVEDIKTDWMHLVDDLELTSSGRYLNHEGRPLVVLWGYTVREDATVDQLEELIDWFHTSADQKYRASIKLGVNDNWFNKDQRWLDAMAQVEVISPWSVGRYSDQSGYDNYITNQITPGLEWCDNHDILYVPVLFPGFSWHNLKEDKPKNQIPRNGGSFFWMQAFGAVNQNVQSLYFAMFDELDEATAMFKTAENSYQAPAQEFWLNLDADGYTLPSDWYLRCAGTAAEMLRGNIETRSSLGTPEEGIMTMRPGKANGCTIKFIFPDFKDQTTLEISLDGGSTYPYSIADDGGTYDLGDIGEGEYDVYIRHPGSEAVPMGNICLEGCYPTSIDIDSPGSAEDGVEISLNPIELRIYIKGLKGNALVEIYDVLGRRCESATIGEPNGIVDISALPGAIYFVSVKDEHSIYTSKIYNIR